jgi:hypothetical protein
MYNIISYSYGHFLFLISYLIAECTVLDNLKLFKPNFFIFGFDNPEEENMDIPLIENSKILIQRSYS